MFYTYSAGDWSGGHMGLVTKRRSRPVSIVLHNEVFCHLIFTHLTNLDVLD